MIYYLIIFILAIFAFVHIIEEDKRKLVGFYFTGIVLMLIFGGLRYEVGADWFSYKKLFEEARSWEIVLSSREEKLFMTFFYISSWFTQKYSIVVLLFFTISFLIKIYVLDKYSPNIFLSLVIYFSAIFLIYDINGIRQGMAIGIVLLTLQSILERRLLQFLMIMTMAMFVHTSSLVFLPFYFVANITISVKWILIVSGIVLLMSIPLRDFMLSNPLFTLVINSDSLTHYNSYLEDNEANKSVEIISIAVFQRVLLLSIVLFNYDKIGLAEDQKRLFLNGYFISFLIFILFSFSTEFSARLAFYYKAFEMILLPLVVTAQKNHFAKIVYFTFFVILSVIAAQRLLSVKDSGLIPYKLYLFN
jgi:hypothetical protein